MRSSTAVGLDAAFGRLTSIPRYIMGAVSMKISRRTSTTSTSGMMLISARFVPIRRAPGDSSILNAIFGGPTDPGRAAQEIEEIQREAFHLDGPVLHAVDEVVVADDGRDRCAEPRGGRDERLRDTGGDHGQARGALGADAVERRHDAPHRAEEADERRGARGGGEEREIVLELGDLERGRASPRAVHRL